MTLNARHAVLALLLDLMMGIIQLEKNVTSAGPGSRHRPGGEVFIWFLYRNKLRDLGNTDSRTGLDWTGLDSRQIIYFQFWLDPSALSTSEISDRDGRARLTFTFTPPPTLSGARQQPGSQVSGGVSVLTVETFLVCLAGWLTDVEITDQTRPRIRVFPIPRERRAGGWLGREKQRGLWFWQIKLMGLKVEIHHSLELL